MPGPVVGIGLVLAASTTAAVLQVMPAPLWRGVSRIVLTCSPNMDCDLCDAFRDAARTHTALLVETSTDTAPTDRRTVMLSIAPADDGRSLVAVARRALEIDDAEGPARHAVAWDAAAPGVAVDALLTRILPRRPKGGRPPE